MTVKKLDNLCDFISGLWTGKKPPYIKVSVIRNTNFHKSGNLDFSDIAELNVEAKQFSTRRLRFGDIILEKSGGGPKQPVGRVCVFEKKEGLFSLSNFTSAIRIKNPRELDYKYLHYYLKHLYITGETEKIQTNSTGIRNLQLGLYKELLVPLPSLRIQQTILAKLDTIFAEIDKATAAAETNTKNAESLFQSYLNEVFESSRDGIEREKLSKVCFYDKNQGIHKNLPYIGMESIESNTAKLISSSKLNTDVKSSTFKFTEEHLLYGRLRPYLNKVFLPNFTGHCSTEIFPIKPKKIITREFLKYWFIRIKTANEINATCTGSRMPRANMNSVMNFEIILPPISVQKLLVEKIDSLNFETNRIKKSCQAKIDELKYLRQSILEQAFNGELVKAA